VLRAAFAVLCLAAAPAAWAQTPRDTLRDTTARRLGELARQVEALRLEVRRQAAELARRDSLAALQEPAVGARARADQAPEQRLRQVSGIATRPFLYRGVGAAVGGYVDLEFARDFDASSTTFVQHRLIPFIFAEISDRLHFGTELEFEYGGPNAGARDDGELKVEFAAFDLNVTRALNFRAGALLSPLGKFNLIHDSPVNDLTDRPLVDQSIIPTTLTEAGAGLFGQAFPSGASVLTYEAYVVNGFDNNLIEYDVSSSGTITPVTSIRSARGSMRRDNNAAKSLVGRIAFSPALGIELGVSGHAGVYSDAGSGRLTIGALDAIVARGRWELLGEFATASISIDDGNERTRALAAYLAAGFPPAGFDASYAAVRQLTSQRGGYLQLNYHFLQGAVPEFPNSTFTGVVRVDHLDVDGDTRGNLEERLSLGLNWRPIEQTAIKVDYQWNWTTPAGAANTSPPVNKLVASVATYF
jgi:hypothetical protein